MLDEHSIRRRRRVAVVGGGVAGLTASWVLSKSADVTLYEAAGRLGGHADTHRVPTPSGDVIPVDTGFIVHNDRTYPTLLRLFAELGVTSQDSDMSMSIRCDGCGLVYSGGQGLRGLLPTPSTLGRARYMRMLLEVRRFHRTASAMRTDGGDDDRTLQQFLTDGAFSAYFTAHFMTPLVSAVWSCNSSTALQYPTRSLFAFLDHHGMLSVGGSPTWRTVRGGSVEYVRRVAARIGEVRVDAPVRAVHRHADRVEIRDDSDDLREFDAVVVATHPQQALKLLAAPTALHHEVLGAMPYSVNHAQLHTDESVLPRAPRARASWNYCMPSCASRPEQVLVSYDLSRLQRLPDTGERYVVTLGGSDVVDPERVLDTMEYEHPQYTPSSLAAQRRLPELSDHTVAFAGAYHGWGFHEDGALSGVRAAESVGGRWT
ncbi:NAD(P)/FAD-dependent oxidoreductase [Rhodococcus xishaensis]|uniref:Amine oxidase n=1 Tax=Rhodococcus xishaensis TaxID=2487364 RepID=A0A438B306_9NOCA|nr:FAD-dependent oxidoreductase [Rhodococcus xishaensis]RVW05332.1 amine oxidase [Rhodococcus xishaensis]